MTPAKPKSEQDEFGKVDRILELKVIDWLQWAEFPEDLRKTPDDSDMAQLALILIAKRKSLLDESLAEIERLRDNLREIAMYKNRSGVPSPEARIARAALEGK